MIVESFEGGNKKKKERKMVKGLKGTKQKERKIVKG